MNEPPTNDERIIEAVEACRPGRDDVSDAAMADLLEELAVNPELARHYERLQQCDANLSSAFRGVPVPDGLQQRLLARVEQAQTESGPAPDDEAERIAAAATTVVQPKRFSRRRLLTAGGITAAAAVLAIGVTVYLLNSQPYTRANVLENSVAFFDSESPNLAGELVDRTPPPEAYPFSRSVGRVPAMRWRPISQFLGRTGVAYDLTVRGRATLYVVRRTVPGLDANPPLRPQKDTGGFSAATWQEGELLYVLVLHGNNSRTVYRSLVDLPHGPLL
ncbi:MAG TPA: hypothetical protein VE890_04990 [Thermoguttaceae bacterium]|nr:hypothetical protein [Thermoguttaceae bacterium]